MPPSRRPSGLVLAQPPQQERSQASTQRLLRAVGELIAERGYTDTTMVAIGERAGFSRGLVNARFGSKEALVWAFVEQGSSPWLPQFLTPSTGGTGLDDVLEATEAIASHAVTEPITTKAFMRLIIDSKQSMPSLHERFQRSFRSLRRRLGGFYAQGIEDGSIRPDVDPDAEAAMLLAAWRGITLQWIVYPELTDLRVLYDTLLDQLARDLPPS